MLYPELKFAFPNNINVFRELYEFKPDIIHIVTPFSIGLSGFMYARSRNIPLVSSYHTNIPQYLKYFKIDFLEHITWNFFRWFHSKCLVNYCPSNVRKELSLNGLEYTEGRSWDEIFNKLLDSYRAAIEKSKMKKERKKLLNLSIGDRYYIN